MLKQLSLAVMVCSAVSVNASPMYLTFEGLITSTYVLSPSQSLRPPDMGSATIALTIDLDADGYLRNVGPGGLETKSDLPGVDYFQVDYVSAPQFSGGMAYDWPTYFHYGEYVTGEEVLRLFASAPDPSRQGQLYTNLIMSTITSTEQFVIGQEYDALGLAEDSYGCDCPANWRGNFTLTSITEIPEPGTLALFALGGGFLVFFLRPKSIAFRKSPLA